MAARIHTKKPKYDLSERVAKKSTGSVDRVFLTTVIMIVVIGLIMLFSASYPDANYREGDGLKYIKSQALYAVAGFIVMFFAARFDYKYYKKWLKIIMLAVIAALVLVYAMPARQGARRWIPLGFTTIQPSEFAKIAIIIYCASFFSDAKEKINDIKHLIFNMIPIVVVLALVVFEPHFSAFIIMSSVIGIMLLVGGFSPKVFWIAVGVLIPLLSWFASMADYRMARIDAWSNPFDPAIYKTSGWQIAQCLYAIGSGGLFGLGFGNSRQKYMYVSEPQNDTIFAIVCEELGLLGAIAILALFGFLIWRGIKIALEAKDSFGSLLALGITALVGVQVFLNIAVVTNLIPATGVPLPFFSAGGTALVVLMGEMGIMLNISAGGKIKLKK